MNGAANGAAVRSMPESPAEDQAPRAAVSDRLGWVGLRAARCREAPAITDHFKRLVGVTPGGFPRPARIA
jgi:hypothetical protein